MDCPQLRAIVDFLANRDQNGKKVGYRLHDSMTGVKLKAENFMELKSVRLNPLVRQSAHSLAIQENLLHHLHARKKGSENRRR